MTEEQMLEKVVNAIDNIEIKEEWKDMEISDEVLKILKEI